MPGNAFCLLYWSQNGGFKSLNRYDAFNCWVQDEVIRRFTESVITK